MKTLSITTLAAVLVLSACGSPSDQAERAIADTAKARADSITNSDSLTDLAATTATVPTTAWSYAEDRDEMRDTTTKFATAVSSTTLQLGFPYEPGPARMVIRKRSTDGLNVMVSINGQFTCRQYNGDRIAVKFDDEAIQNFRCGESDGGSSDTLFILDAQRFVTKLKTAEKVTIEVPIYDAGNQQISFNVAGLVWE